MGNPGSSRQHAATKRCEVFSSVKSRHAMSFAFPRSADLLWKRFCVSEGTPYQHGRPVEMRGCLFDRPCLSINIPHFPDRHAVSAQIGFPARHGSAERNSGKFSFKRFLNNVPGDKITLGSVGGLSLFDDQSFVTWWNTTRHISCVHK